MKKIKYTKGRSILVGPFLITSDGVDVTESMLSNQIVQNLLHKGILELYDEGQNQENNIQNQPNIEQSKQDEIPTVSVSQPQNVEEVKITETIVESVTIENKNQELPKVEENIESVSSTAEDKDIKKLKVEEIESVTVNNITIDNPIIFDKEDITVTPTSEFVEQTSSMAEIPIVIAESKTNPALKEPVNASELIDEDIKKITEKLKELTETPTAPVQKKS